MITEGIAIAGITTFGGVLIAFVRRMTLMKAQITKLEGIGDTLEKMGADKLELLDRMATILADVSEDVDMSREAIIEMRTQINNLMNIQVNTASSPKRLTRRKRKKSNV